VGQCASGLQALPPQLSSWQGLASLSFDLLCTNRAGMALSSASALSGAAQTATGHPGRAFGQLLPNVVLAVASGGAGAAAKGADAANVASKLGTTAKTTDALGATTRTADAANAARQGASGTALARQLGSEGEAAVPGAGNSMRIPSASGSAAYRIPDILNP